VQVKVVQKTTAVSWPTHQDAPIRADEEVDAQPQGIRSIERHEMKKCSISSNNYRSKNTDHRRTDLPIEVALNHLFVRRHLVTTSVRQLRKPEGCPFLCPLLVRERVIREIVQIGSTAWAWMHCHLSSNTTWGSWPQRTALPKRKGLSGRA